MNKNSRQSPVQVQTLAAVFSTRFDI